MELMKPKDLDLIDEESVEVHEGHPVDVIVSIRLAPDESRLLGELAEREGTDEVGALRAALHEYAARRPHGAGGRDSKEERS